MTRAVAVYRSLGFRETKPYHEVPEPFASITCFMEMDLRP
jgi:hypothetical protein